MNNMWTVIRFTFMNKVRTKSFVVSTLIFALLITIGINIPFFIQLFSGDQEDQGGAPQQIGLVYGEQAAIAEELQSTMEEMAAQYKLIQYDTLDETMLNSDVSSGLIDGYIRFEAQEGQSFPAVIYSSEDDVLEPQLQAVLQAALQGAKTRAVLNDLSLSDEQIQEINTPVQISTRSVEEAGAGNSEPEAEEAASNEPINFIIVYALVILFFVTLMSTGNMIASEVTTEKSSRIMEILITSVSPLSQMFGKIIGMFLLGLTQILTFVIVAVVNLMLPHNTDAMASLDLNFGAVDPMLLVFGLLFYIFGYFLYAVLFAAVGSIVSRTEDLGQAIMPITMLSLAAFYIAIFSLGAPNSTLMKVSSYIPFVSPTSVIVRIGLGDAPLWEVLVSLGILLVSILVFGWLAAKIYRTGVLMYGKRPSFKELRKAMKAYKI
ncbi:putative membrane protein [Paenibacillus algicola]|uniref:Putative membrane protein n=1 Tax=Paenibacillus algicola TaxID=2565926 RepID=A0A4P8XM24_9BACL|nr:ABC transporter permease [Paenibacillus algicola]QCT01269.1 putative membrane protein [Paenibacillus algicola]